MTTSALIEEIVTEINNLEQEFRRSKGLILSEDDLKCHLFRKIYPLLDHCQQTMDINIFASPLHTEIKFFDENGKLSLVPDITILKPNDLSILHSVEYKVTRNGIKPKGTSSKGFEFGGDTIIFELKFCKTRKGISKKKLMTYLCDIEKIKRLQNIITTRSGGSNKIFGIFVIFNKTNKKVREFDEFISLSQNISDLKVIYGTAIL
jgi:hypothetical protein